ncbi:MAG TPA: hypothetical protein VHB98_04345, partial [Chloroflexota bacterium]|nr:hypothetical protein [Chloroflexota bacterium]
NSHSWSSHVIEFLAVGTAIVSTSAEHHIATPQLSISLSADRHPPSVAHPRPATPSSSGGSEGGADTSGAF